LREDGLDRLRETGQAVDAGDQHVGDAALAQVVRTASQNFAPSVSCHQIPSTSRSPSTEMPTAR
jgi:DNA-binding IclR family transcriptional regulator